MSWPLVELGSICERVTVGHVGKTSDYYTDASGVPFLRTQNVSSKGISLKGLKYVTQDFHQKLKKSQLKEGDVILSRVVSSEINCGIIPKSLEESNCANIIISRPSPTKLDSKYLLYCLRSSSVQRNLLGRQVGSAQSVVNTNVFKSWKIPLPPLPEQKRIAAILDKSDAIRRKRQQAIELADEFLRSVFLDMFGDPVVNPKGWEVKRIGDFCTFQGGYAFKSTDYVKIGVPLVKITNVHIENIDWSEVDYIPVDNLETRKDFLLKPNDLVMAMTRPVIKSLGTVKLVEVKKSDIPCFLNQRVGRFKDFEDTVSKDYLKHFLLSDYFKGKIEGLCSVALQPNISSKQIEDISISIPDIASQNKFSQVVTNIYRIKKNCTDSFKGTDDAFHSLSQRAFSGNL